LRYERGYIWIGDAEHGQRAVEMHRSTDRVARWAYQAALKISDQTVEDVAMDRVEVRCLDRPIERFERRRTAIAQFKNVSEMKHTPLMRRQLP